MGAHAGSSAERFHRPAQALFALEPFRAATELAAFAAAMPSLSRLPRGDGRSVLVLPGFTASDASTEPLRWFLRDRGYRAFGWELGRNFGPSKHTVDGLLRRLAALRNESGEPVTLIGWSLGGVYARALAEHVPADVRHVITLGAPFRMGESADTNVGVLYRALSRVLSTPTPGTLRTGARYSGPPPVPCTSIYTHADGVVPWESCVEDASDHCESIEVCGSHMGLGHNPAALVVIADRLRLAPGRFVRFDPRTAQHPFPFPAVRAVA